MTAVEDLIKRVESLEVELNKLQRRLNELLEIHERAFSNMDDRVQRNDDSISEIEMHLKIGRFAEEE